MPDARDKNNLCKMSRTFKIDSIRSHNDKPFVTGSTLFVSLKGQKKETVSWHTPNRVNIK